MPEGQGSPEQPLVNKVAPEEVVGQFQAVMDDDPTISTAFLMDDIEDTIEGSLRHPKKRVSEVI